MKKGLLLLMAGVMALGVAAQSLASVRIDSMASNPRLVEDFDSIFLYANKVLEYKNTVDLRMSTDIDIDSGFGGSDDAWGGLLIEEENLGGVLGIYVNRPNRKYTASHSLTDWVGDPANTYWYYPGGSANSFSGPPGGFTEGFVPSNILDIFYGVGLEGADLGFHLNYGDNGIGGTETTIAGLSVGLGFKDFGPFNEANITAGYSFYKWTQVGGDTDNGISTINVGGLFSADAGNDTTLRLSADVNVHNADETDEDGEKQSEISALLGLGCNHKVNGGKGLVSSGLLMSWVGGTYDDGVASSFNAWHIYWNASVEAAVTNWLTLRTGLQAGLLDRGYYENGGPSYFDNVDDNVIFTTGFGITWQNFTIDGFIDIDALQDWLSGPNAGAGIFYPGSEGDNAQGIVEVAALDLKYKF